MVAAAANPLLAIEELGYQISSDVRQEFEDRIRFGPERAEQLRSLREEIYGQAGKIFDLASPDALFETLSGLLPQAPGHPGPQLRRADVEPLVPQVMSPTKPADPLEAFRNVHPVMEPLLEYRRVEASTPRFAAPEIYSELRRGTRGVPVSNIVAHLKEPAT
jgi:hypothetical protein